MHPSRMWRPPKAGAQRNGALLDLIQECEQEEARCRQNGVHDLVINEIDSAMNARMLESLISLVRREVREVVDREVSAMRRALPTTQDHGSHGFTLRPEERLAGGSASRSGCASGAPSSSETLPSTSDSSRTLPSISDSSRTGSPRSMKHQDREDSDCISERLKAAEARISEHRQSLTSLREALTSQAGHWDQTWKGEAELRAEGDQEVEARFAERFGARLDNVETQVAQVNASVGSLARLQVELGSEAKLRQDADGRLQVFLMEFRAHVVAEVEEMRTRQRQMTDSLAAMEQIGVSRLATNGFTICPKSGRVTSPDELEVTFGDSGSLPCKVPSVGSSISLLPACPLAAPEGPRCDHVLPCRTVTLSPLRPSGSECAGNAASVTTAASEPRQGVPALHFLS